MITLATLAQAPGQLTFSLQDEPTADASPPARLRLLWPQEAAFTAQGALRISLASSPADLPGGFREILRAALEGPGPLRIQALEADELPAQALASFACEGPQEVRAFLRPLMLDMPEENPPAHELCLIVRASLTQEERDAILPQPFE